MNGKQISMFELLGEPETPLIPVEEQKKGRCGWIIDISAIMLQKNGWKEDAVCVCTVPVVFEEDTKKDKYGRMWQMAKSIHGSPMGWMGSLKKVYAKRPSWKECEEYAHSKYTIPQTVKYYERDGHDKVTWEYENGYSKERY